MVEPQQGANYALLPLQSISFLLGRIDQDPSLPLPLPLPPPLNRRLRSVVSQAASSSVSQSLACTQRVAE